MGTMIQRYKLQEADYRGERFKDHPKDIKGNNEMLQLVKPEVLREIHAQYLAAGADIIETNTFGATSVAQDDYGLGHLAREMNVAAARLAREVRRPVRRRPTSRASSPARWAPRRAPPASAPTSTTRARATRASTSSRPPTASRPKAWSRAAPTCSWSRPSSTRSTPRPPSSRSTS